MELKPLQQIELLQKEKEKLEFRCKFLEDEKKKDSDAITELKYELITLQYQNSQLRRECLALRENGDDSENVPQVDLDSDTEDQEPVVPEPVPSASYQAPSSWHNPESIKPTRRMNRQQTESVPSRRVSISINPRRECPQTGCSFATIHASSLKRHINMHAREIHCQVEDCHFKTTNRRLFKSHLSKKHFI